MEILLGITWIILGVVIFIYGIKEEHPIAGLGLLLIFIGFIPILMTIK